MKVVYKIDSNLSRRVAEPELLVKFIILANKLCPLFSNILSHSIHFVGEGVTQMKSILNPGQWDTTELNITEGLFFILIVNTL